MYGSCRRVEEWGFQSHSLIHKHLPASGEGRAEQAAGAGSTLAWAGALQERPVPEISCSLLPHSPRSWAEWGQSPVQALCLQHVSHVTTPWPVVPSLPASLLPQAQWSCPRTPSPTPQPGGVGCFQSHIRELIVARKIAARNT